MKIKTQKGKLNKASTSQNRLHRNKPRFQNFLSQDRNVLKQVNWDKIDISDRKI